jgi:hypothetical protein
VQEPRKAKEKWLDNQKVSHRQDSKQRQTLLNCKNFYNRKGKEKSFIKLQFGADVSV